MRCGRFPWGGFLILAGVLFLFSHIVPFSFNIWRIFWPLLLIWWGLRLVVDERKRPLSPLPLSKQQTGEVQYLSVPIKQVEEAHIRVRHQGGRLEIHGDTAPDELLVGTFGVAGVAYALETAVDDVLHLDMQMPTQATLSTDKHDWKFGLNHEIPMSLSLSTAASQGTLDLSALQLSEIRLQSGTSELTVILPAHARYTLVQVESGAEAIRLFVPEGVAAHIRAKEDLEVVQIDKWRFPSIGHVYESEAYDEAEHRVDIHINEGVRQISIQ